MSGFALLAALLAQSPPPLVSVSEPAAPIVEVKAAEGADDFSRTRWRIHVSAGGGVFSSGGATGDGAGFLSIGKPLYLSDRHERYQWVTDSLILVGFAPRAKTSMLLITPTFGMNHYFGPYFGLEWRVGLGFGATPGANTDLGLGISVEGSMVLRPFKDDRKRIKLQLQGATTHGFLTNVEAAISGFALAYETPL